MAIRAARMPRCARPLVVLLALSACAVGPPAPTLHHELILDITNNRDEAVVVRILPRILEGVGLPPLDDQGDGDGTQVEPHERKTVRLQITSAEWTMTVNGRPMYRSTDHNFIAGGWTAGRFVFDTDGATSELERPQPAPSN